MVPCHLLITYTDETFITGVYRKPTLTDLDLQLDSQQNLASKYNVINTLTHRAKEMCPTSQLLKEELHQIEEVLMRCKYSKWAIYRVLSNQENKRKSTPKRHNPTDPQTRNKCHIVVPYSQGLCENNSPSVTNIEYKYILKKDRL